MAIPLDEVTATFPGAPPPAPMSMPAQDFSAAPAAQFARTRVSTFLARLVTFGGALALTAYATWQMFLIVSLTEVTGLQWVLVVLFGITFGWIALAGTSAIAGVLFGGRTRMAGVGSKPTSRTVLLMPVYNEEPARTFAGLQAMGNQLIKAKLNEHFEIFVISDTRMPEVWVKETAALASLREFFGDKMKVWYRRRHENAGKKAGNVHDFVTRWGARYDFMVVLDADSVLSADALRAMVCEIEADPRCGILQTVPKLCGGVTLFGQLQQFAGAIYGPIVARGVAAWQGEDGNYWGHNAVIRMVAFSAAAGLPKLRGRKPFGGEILSHDFVEAALVRRAGWSVRMLPDLEGSWEESPPSLIDVAVRDRRWAQGNVQHLAVISAKGLRWPNRLHMLIGVMSYLASPLWLVFMTVGIVIVAQIATSGFDYFSAGMQLFPSWPVFDSERMIDLFMFTMSMLLLPKVFGVIRALFNAKLRRALGIFRLCLSALIETVLSALYAPIFMLMQSQHIWEIFRGHDSGWSTQQRQQQATPWAMFFKRHIGHTLVGVGVSTALVFVSLPLLAWMSPTVLGLALAIFLSALSGSVVAASALRRLRLLLIPEDIVPPAVFVDRDRFESALRLRLAAVDLHSLVNDDALREGHFCVVAPPPPAPRGSPALNFVSAEIKIAQAEGLDEAMSWFSHDERIAVLSDPKLCNALSQLVQRGRDTLPPPNLTAQLEGGHESRAT